jgi:hypothetical protein
MPFISHRDSLLLVYYRIYSDKGPVEVTFHFYREDPFLGYALASRIEPPHSAANIKCYISEREHVAEHTGTILFADLDHLESSSPFEDDDPVDIVNPTGPGSAPGNPVHLIIVRPLKLEFMFPSFTPVVGMASESPRSLVTPSESSLPSLLGGIPRHAGYDYRVKTLVDVTSGSSYFVGVKLSFQAGDILYTDGVITKGQLGCFRSRVHVIMFQSLEYLQTCWAWMSFRPKTVMGKWDVRSSVFPFPVNMP